MTGSISKGKEGRGRMGEEGKIEKEEGLMNYFCRKVIEVADE